jgi:threonine/homoserine/homoserine lactone efflux protein
VRVESVPMRIDLSDLDRMEGIAEALGRFFWCLMAVAFLAAILGSPGTGLLILVLGGAAFCVRVGFEDFVRDRRGAGARPAKRRPTAPDAEITIHRSARKRRTRSTV